jgi:hypothetical protein
MAWYAGHVYEQCPRQSGVVMAAVAPGITTGNLKLDISKTKFLN